jgi:hypothetical protein
VIRDAAPFDDLDANLRMNLADEARKPLHQHVPTAAGAARNRTEVDRRGHDRLLFRRPA